MLFISWCHCIQLHFNSSVDFQSMVEFSFQFLLSFALLVIDRVVPKLQLFFQFLVLVKLHLVELQISKFGVQLIDILNLLCFFCVFFEQGIVHGSYFLNVLDCLAFGHLKQFNSQQQSKSDKAEIKQPFLIYNYIEKAEQRMKGKTKQPPIFIEIGKNITRSKPQSRKETFSLVRQTPSNTHTTTPSTAPHIRSAQNSVPSNRKVSLPQTKTTKVVAYTQCMNDQFLFMRKENHLNTHFNLRKNRLKQITKENKQIYQRLNSQKSLYSSIELNKSFELNNGVRKRLSESKLSQRSNSSRISDRSKASSKGGKLRERKTNTKIEIKTSSINSIQKNDLSSFKALFSSDTGKAKSILDKNEEMNSFSLNSYRKNDIYTRPYRQAVRNTLEPLNQNEKKLSMGGLLHRIEEEMKPKNQSKNSKKISNYMKPTRAFAF